jgi:tight adherence protein B
MINNLLYFILFFSFSTFAQNEGAEKSAPGIDFFVDILGKKGVAFAIGIIIFFFSYKNAIKFFAWIEDQTYGTRDYILKKCELLYIDMDPNRVTYILLFLTFGLSSLIIIIFSLIGKFSTGLFLGAIVGFVGWKVPRPFMNYLVERRINAYSLQMVDALNLLANGLRAGLSVPQAIGMVVDELPNPVSQEFNTILQNTRIGVTLEEALENLAKRIPTEDNDMFVTSVNILRETGGNLAEVFDTITEVIRERVRLKQKIDTYIAQGFFQGLVIFCMPFAITALFASSDPASMAPLFNTILGNIIIMVALAFNLAGGYVILKIIKVKV